jgi:hypothetical protein
MSTPLVIVVSEPADPILVIVEGGSPGTSAPPVILLPVTDDMARVVTGVLTNFFGDPVTMPMVGIYQGTNAGKPLYYGAGSPTDPYISWDGALFTLITGDNSGTFTSSEDVPTPELVNTWVPQGGATGTPIISVVPNVDAIAIGQLCRVGNAAPYHWWIAATAGVGTPTWSML